MKFGMDWICDTERTSLCSCIGCSKEFEMSLEKRQAAHRYNMRGRTETLKMVKVGNVAKTELLKTPTVLC